MVQIVGRRLELTAALAAVAVALALPSTAARAESEVAVGGYLDLSAGAGAAPALNPGEAPPLSANLGRLAVTDAGRRATLTYF
ncbi:MAG TPA: hypothetical protein VFG47_14125, partial [Geminicoccaceae bacterium]|nr:hypothetical protein [Geminicoccaceae bacterium]